MNDTVFLMKRPLLGMAGLMLVGLLTLNCGSGKKSVPVFALIVRPESASIWTNERTNEYLDVVLAAVLNNDQPPATVQWTTTEACVAPGGFFDNTTTVICSFSCNRGPTTATITATAQGFTATSSVKCTWE